MKKAAGCLALPIAASLVCIGMYYVLTFVVAGHVAEKLPEPFKSIAWEWILGEPQQVGHPTESDVHLTYPGEIVESGSFYWEPISYNGPESFQCSLPVASGYLTSRYGDTNKRSRAHTGIDYGTHGTPTEITAPMSGKVSHAGWSYWLGWTVVIENDGWQMILGHMCCGESGTTNKQTGESSLSVTEGAFIQAGDTLGLTGDTGNSTGVHLHMEFRKCDSEGRCTIRNPENVLLPGQSSYCDWESLKD